MPLIPKKKSKYQIFWQTYRWWILVFSFILLFFILLSPYIFRSWTKYPEELRAEISWHKFESTFTYNCRDECLSERQSYASIWRPIYTGRPELFSEFFNEVFAGDNVELQTALIKIMSADKSDKNLPVVLGKVIASPEASLENKRLIVNFFPEYFNDEVWLQQLRVQLLDESLSLDDRLYALGLLKVFPSQASALSLKKIILSNESEVLLKPACQQIDQWSSDLFLWSDVDIEKLTQLILASKSGPMRWRRLWLLSDIKIDNSKLSELLQVLANNQNLDNISRGIAADVLSQNFFIDINTPDPAAAEWQLFYEQI